MATDMPELIAGSRFMGHDGKDPGEYNPQQFVRISFCLNHEPGNDRRSGPGIPSGSIWIPKLKIWMEMAIWI